MSGDFFNSLSLIDISGYIIIAVIIVTFIAAAIVNQVTRRLYSDLSDDLRTGAASGGGSFRQTVLNKIIRDTEDGLRKSSEEINTQALIEHHFKRELKGAFTAERFLKSASGLLIILGLVGTFYGLTLSIGKLVSLITGNVSEVVEITQALTTGLAGALSGMSVAFSTSLFGIVGAIAVTLLNVFANLPEKRSGVMLQLEVYLDELRQRYLEKSGGSSAGAKLSSDARTIAAIESLGNSVLKFQQTVVSFESALAGFAKNTRDFQEFNLHLKDNVQRMSLGFADLSETLKNQVAQLKSERTR